MAYGTANVDNIQSSTVGTPVVFKDGGGTQIGTLCRAWVNFNGTTSPGTIRASFNVGSVTKNGTGDYTVNFTTAMSDANYAANVTTQTGGIVSATTYDSGTARTTTALRVCALTTAGSFVDSAQMGVAIFR